MASDHPAKLFKYYYAIHYNTHSAFVVSFYVGTLNYGHSVTSQFVGHSLVYGVVYSIVCLLLCDNNSSVKALNRELQQISVSRVHGQFPNTLD